MANASKWMAEGRRREEAQDLRGAIDQYRKALAWQEETSGSPDLNLLNRVGDLHSRCGETDHAIRAYEQAIVRYEEQQLFANGIALCKKILRNAPDHTRTYRRVGELLAASGLEVEARAHLKEFIARSEREGNMTGALEVLRELVERTDDEELRVSLADRYHLAGRDQEALSELRIVWEAKESRGEDASEIRARIVRIDPDVDVDAGKAVEGGCSGPSDPASTPASAPEPTECDVEALAGELQQVLDGVEGEERIRRALPILDQLLRHEPQKIDLLVRKLRYALALDEESSAIDAYVALGIALEARLSRFSLRLLTTSSSSGSATAAISVETRSAAGKAPQRAPDAVAT